MGRIDSSSDFSPKSSKLVVSLLYWTQSLRFVYGGPNGGL